MLVVEKSSGGAYITSTVPFTPDTLFPVSYSLVIFFFLFIIVLYLASNSMSFYLSGWNHFSVASVCLLPLLPKVPQISCVQQTVLSRSTVEKLLDSIAYPSFTSDRDTDHALQFPVELLLTAQETNILIIHSLLTTSLPCPAPSSSEDMFC